MSDVYPTQSPVTAQELWAEICDVAQHGNSTAGLLKRQGNGWELSCLLKANAVDLASVFVPLLEDTPAERPMVVAHLAQSMDGRIARLDGESHWITGDADLDHTHRLRAVCDAVLVGANTVQVDDCKLTVRRCTGENPVRVVLDPAARVSPTRTIFRDGEAPTLWIVGDGQPAPVVDGDFEVEVLPCADGHIATSHVLEVLQARGINRLFVEGGGVTVSHFLRVGRLDRLHLAVAPLLLGEGRASISARLGRNLAACPRPKVKVYPMGDDWLFDCAFERSAT
jgi:diaminohydroxyphosphoribosylaminopyrimidine deaminase/5-amino-6-(5-phosphoribosylamino)uracil reductase